ncbi:putative disease resistance RPP13-like protein 3 [Miscanthus floridulus]|uniref:putative disease resistance RPP13-like protein 3 n=1 Tax=Miscanthus floridulus TaxID=154761 RepID=UPI003458413E
MDLGAGAVGIIVTKHGELLHGEYKLQKGLQEQIEYLKNELESAHKALCKVGATPPEQQDPQVLLWAREVREASYDMEDILDAFLVNVVEGAAPSETKSKKGLLKRLKKKMARLLKKSKARHDIAGAIEDMKKRLQEVSGRRDRYSIPVAVPSPATKLDPRLVDIHNEAAQIIGIERTWAELIAMLQSSTHGHGDAGVLQQQQPDQDSFCGRSWWSGYFIVIDDIWDLESWKAIGSALDKKSSGSRIIKTTRNREVACSDEVYYKLDPLSHDNSKKLFYMRLYGGEDKCPAHHPEEASQKILDKCGGVPLAVITMASLLVAKSREDWFEVCSSPGFYRGRDNKQVDDTVWILSLSYYDLPSHLKTCLLYLSVYPEDYEIEKDSLIWKWVAEGFIEKKTGTSLFQRGEEYFHQLINRNMIQGMESEFDGIMHRCRVHDMVLDLIHGLAGEENFITISNEDGGTSSRHKRCAHHPEYGRRCSEHLGKLVHLRYLGLRGTKVRELPEAIGALKLLQTLDLEGIRGYGMQVELPSSLSLLTRLVCIRSDKYTKVRDGLLQKVTSLEELQISVRMLSFESKRQFFKELGNQSLLRVLRVVGIGRLDESAQAELLKSLGNLQELEHLHLDCNLLTLTRHTSPLHVFQFRITSPASVEWDNAVLPEHLSRLRIHCIWFPCVPSFIDPTLLPNLWYLDLCVDHMDEAGLRTLGALAELGYLCIRDDGMDSHEQADGMASHEQAAVVNIAAHDVFFPKLRIVKLEGWMVQLATNGDSTSASFSIWRGGQDAAMVFDSKAEDANRSSRVAPPPIAVMPNLDELVFTVPVRAFYKDGHATRSDNLGLDLECLPSLRCVEARLNCMDAFPDDVDKAEAELRRQAQLHPNSSALRFYVFKVYEDMMAR